MRGWRAHQEDYRRTHRARRIARAGGLLALVLLATSGAAGLVSLAGREATGSGAATAAAAGATADPPAPVAPEAGFPLPASALRRLDVVDGAAYTTLDGGRRARLTIDPGLQRRAETILARARPIAGAIVLLDARDGRVLAMASSARAKGLGVVALEAGFPAASLFKVVTAAAGLEAGTLTPTTTIRTVGGGLHRLRPEHLADNPKRERSVMMTMEQALARSNNPVFGKVAVKRVGADRLSSTADAFAFNRPIPFDLPLGVSRADVPDDPLGLGRTGAGFGEVTISPVHAAVLAAAIANEGRMPRPWLVEAITDAAGRVLFEGGPAPLGAPVTPGTAKALGEMMIDTVTRGTGRRAFRSSRLRQQGIQVAGKTGSLSGRNPGGHYDWFAGFAPAGDPEVAVAALLVNGPRWHLKGSGAAREALEAYFERALPGSAR